MNHFTARACFVGDHHAEHSFVIVLAERDDDDVDNDGDNDGDNDDSERLVLQLLDGTDDEDRRQGLDVYSLRTSTGARHHNSVSAWSIEGTQLTLRLQRKALVLDVDEGYVIELSPVSSQLQQLRAGLARIIDGM